MTRLKVGLRIISSPVPAGKTSLTTGFVLIVAPAKKTLKWWKLRLRIKNHLRTTGKVLGLNLPLMTIDTYPDFSIYYLYQKEIAS